MSVQATTWVWQHSEAKGNARLVLLAIADAADQEGDNAWPAQATIAEMVRISVRQVRRIIDDLVISGELEVEEFAGGTARTRPDRRPHLYRLSKMPGRNGRTFSPNDRTDTSNGRTSGVHGRTFSCERADTDVRLTPFLNTQIEQPSGGAPSAPAQAHAVDPEEETATPEETPMPTATDPAQAQLFDVETPEPPPAEARKSEGAQAVVAAYVDAWRQFNASDEPLRAHKGRIARDAKALLAKGEASQEELVKAAREMASGPFCNLQVQLNMLRRGRGRSGPGNVPAVPQHDPGWVEADERQAQELTRYAADPAVAALRARYVNSNVA